MFIPGPAPETDFSFGRHRDEALTDIGANRGKYVQAAAAAFYEMLKAAPPAGQGARGDLTDDDLRKIAQALAETYVTVVEKILQKWPGARTLLGASFGMWKEGLLGIERSEEEIAIAPLCVDWCRALATELDFALSKTHVKLPIGEVKLARLVRVKKAQDWGMFEHNFPIVHAAGQAPERTHRILDAWVTIRPRVAGMGKYDLDLVGGPYANMARLRNKAKHRIHEAQVRRLWEILREAQDHP
ncbi:MAG TPA: hypothetical protein EYP04_12880 [Anaerolineae bacterium]|nr:hypothetical protein [Anaerolineae bacterium]